MKGFPKYILIICLACITNAWGAEKFVKWEQGEINLPDLKLNDLPFTNRARCALNSKLPSTSTFLLIQNSDVARGIYRLAKATEHNTTDLTKMGIQVFRYSVVELTRKIHNLLMEGKLPLLTPDIENKNIPPEFKKLRKECEKSTYCFKLDEYLGSIWKNVHLNESLEEVDKFNFKKHFIKKSSLEVGNKKLNYTCKYLKKFSPLQAHLFGAKPNSKAFKQMAKTMINRDEYIGECDDLEIQDSFTVGAYQIDLGPLKIKNWNKIGFAYWNSLKLFFSWAWRNSEEFAKISSPFTDVFRSVAIEDAVYLVPNGCGGLTPPHCNGDYLQLNSLRKFVGRGFKENALNLDVLKEIPEGPTKDLLDNEFPSVNTDILELGRYENAEKWLEGFSDNLRKSRAVMKRRLFSSMANLNLITKHISIEKIIEGIGLRFKEIGLSGDEINPVDLTAEKKDLIRNELFYLCGEFIQAIDKDLSFIKGDLEILKQVKLVDRVADGINDKTTSEFFSYYEKMANSINDKCNSLKQHDIWDDTFKLDKSGFSSWYIEKVYENKFESKAQEKFQMVEGRPLLSFKGLGEFQSFEDVICVNAVHCARKTLASIVNLHAVAKYANTFWSMDQKIKTPALFNPYAERTSCKVYDPWFKTKQIIFNLFSNLGQAAMSAFVPGAVFADLSLKPGRVVSFKELVKEGKIHYDINRKRASIFNGFTANFGKLIGVPCQVTISRNFNNPYNYYMFSGITIGGCYERDRGVINMYSGSDYDDVSKPPLAACASCSLSFTSVVDSLTAVSSFAPYAGSAMFFIQGMMNLIQGFMDPHNIPKSWKVNPNFVLDTYRRFGEIPKKCIKRLYRGKPCLKNRKEEKVTSIVRNALSTNIKGMESRVGGAKVSIHGCEELIDVDTIRKIITLPKSCQGFKNGFYPISIEKSSEPGESFEYLRPEDVTVMVRGHDEI